MARHHLLKHSIECDVLWEGLDHPIDSSGNVEVDLCGRMKRES